MGLISCYNELAVQLSQNSSSSHHKNVSKSISPNSPPSIQTTTTNVYTTTASTGVHRLITVTWRRSATAHGLEITSGDNPTTGFRLNTNSRFFNKKRGIKAFEIDDSKFEVFYDLSSAVYGAGAQPVGRYYVVIMVDSELGLFVGDMSEEALKKVKINKQIEKFILVSRREYYSGDGVCSTKARFSGDGDCHDIIIRCTRDSDGVKTPSLCVWVDKRVVFRVKRLKWNFRGCQTVFIDGVSVDVMWDVQEWLFGSGSKSWHGSGRAVFMFRTKKSMDSRLWLNDKMKYKDERNEFSLLIYVTNTSCRV